MELAEKGKNWDGKPLNENNLKSSQWVLWRNKEYMTGNRRHELVELWKEGTLRRIVNTKHITLVKHERTD